MKIVFSNLPMKKQLNQFRYVVDGNSSIEYDGEVIFPINSVLARALKKDESVKVVLLKKQDVEGNSDINAGEFMRELNQINRTIGAVIEYKIIEMPFVETKDTHELALGKMVDELVENAEIYCDITYGPKPLPIVLFSVLNFAEKFYKCKIENIVYGKVDFLTKEDGTTYPSNPVLFDVTPLYYLNAFTNTIECKSAEEAKNMLHSLLDF